MKRLLLSLLVVGSGSAAHAIDLNCNYSIDLHGKGYVESKTSPLKYMIEVPALESELDQKSACDACKDKIVENRNQYVGMYALFMGEPKHEILASDIENADLFIQLNILGESESIPCLDQTKRPTPYNFK